MTARRRLPMPTRVVYAFMAGLLAANGAGRLAGLWVDALFAMACTGQLHMEDRPS